MTNGNVGSSIKTLNRGSRVRAEEFSFPVALCRLLYTDFIQYCVYMVQSASSLHWELLCIPEQKYFSFYILTRLSITNSSLLGNELHVQVILLSVKAASMFKPMLFFCAEETCYYKY